MREQERPLCQSPLETAVVEISILGAKWRLLEGSKMETLFVWTPRRVDHPGGSGAEREVAVKAWPGLAKVAY